ncbi:hypothetical protein INT43_000151 [Umbelopsis isabellina]|uniref:Arrestin-like N-terminal domain-containing protein n=1 Tax=Mortierella isabellina TaxID=91625 RepID=A0A8H7PFP0_MORIS|nr:hypothetical protein INT43_000151 [Umbelopsis isabellina]
MKEIIKVDVLPDKECIDVYGPLSTQAPPLQLQGTVRLELSRSAKFKVLNLKFKGYHQVYEKFPDTAMVDARSPIQADICEAQVSLVPPNSTLGTGQHELPFILSIPGNLPQSFENASGHLRYEFTVTAREGSAWIGLAESHKYKRSIQVRRHYIPSLEEAPFLDPRVTFTKRQPHVFDISLEYPSVVPAEQHDFSVFGNIIPLYRRCTPLKVLATLKQVKEARNSSKDPSRPNRTEARTSRTLTFETVIFGPIEYNFETMPTQESSSQLSKAGQRVDIHYDFDFMFKLDQTKLSEHLDSPLLDITHCLLLKVHLPDHQMYEMQVPIVMTTIPSRPPAFEESNSFVQLSPSSQEPETLPKYHHVSVARPS